MCLPLFSLLLTSVLTEGPPPLDLGRATLEGAIMLPWGLHPQTTFRHPGPIARVGAEEGLNSVLAKCLLLTCLISLSRAWGPLELAL